MSEEKIIHGYHIIIYKHSQIYIIENIFENDLCDNLCNIIDKCVVNYNNKRDYSKTNNVLCYSMDMEELIDRDETLYYKFSTNVNEFQSLLSEISLNNVCYKNKNNGIYKVALNHLKTLIISKIDIIKKIMHNVDKNIKINYSTPFELRKIFGETRLHTDGILQIYDSNISYVNKSKRYNDSKNLVRNLSMVSALNDDYENGVFNFPNQDIKIKLKKGSVILFPPYWSHPHEVSEPTNNTYRYTMNTWFCDYSVATIRDTSVIGYK
jgi:hypothetical protein